MARRNKVTVMPLRDDAGWAVDSYGRESVSTSVFDTKEEAVAAAVNLARSRRSGHVGILREDRTLEKVIEVGEPASFQLSLTLSPEVHHLLRGLAEEAGGDEADVLRKALALYKAASDAHREGKAVGVAESPEVLETEFVGFGDLPAHAEPAQEA